LSSRGYRARGRALSPSTRSLPRGSAATSNRFRPMPDNFWEGWTSPMWIISRGFRPRFPSSRRRRRAIRVRSWGPSRKIYDYLRLLFARIGVPHCPSCGREIREQSVDQILDVILSWPSGTKLQVLAPVIRAQKGEHRKVLEDALKQGFLRARVDKEFVDLEAAPSLEKQKNTPSSSSSTASGFRRRVDTALPKRWRPRSALRTVS